MKRKRSVYSFFSWRNMMISILIFFIFLMGAEYLFDRKDYPTLETLFKENALKKGVASVFMGIVTTYFRAKTLHKEHEANAE